MEGTDARPGTPGIGIAGFVVGLLGLLFSLSFVGFFLGGPLSITGIVLSAIGIQRANERGASKALAVAGLTCGIIGLVIAVIVGFSQLIFI